MQHELEIEAQIWEYLDGQCNEADRSRIALLIEQDALWKSCYAEICALQHSLNNQLEQEHPGMRFTGNVMDAIAKEHVAPAARTYLNIWVIRGIAAFFLLVIGTIVADVFSRAGFSRSDSSLFSWLNLDHFRKPSVSDNTLFYGLIFLAIVAALVLLDTLARNRRMQADQF